MQPIELKGARANNLKGIDLTLEPGTLLVLCGPSGAGKSSLAFATLYAEGQRRYVESFSAYARQFLERLARPPLDALGFMPAAIAVDRGGQVKTSRSTVATLTELADCLKQLWALCAELDCPHCGARVRTHSPASARATLCSELPERKLVVTYPLPVVSEEQYLTLRDGLIADGYRRLYLGGEVRDLDQLRPSEVVHGAKVDPAADGPALYVVADRTTTRAADHARLSQALEVAFERGGGQARVFTPEGERRDLSRELRCDSCGRGYRKPSAGLFSFNSPLGACAQCRGFGRVMGVDWDKVFGDRSKTIAQNAIRPWGGKAAQHERKLLMRHCARTGIPTDVPVRELDPKQIESLIEGDGGSWRSGYPGLRRWFAWLETRAYKMHVRVLLSRYRSYDPCPACNGQRFKPEVAGWKVAGVNLTQLYAMEVVQARAFIDQLLQAAPDHQALARVLDECRERLSTLCDVGLGYLTLDRSARSLSGGELQRVTLTSALDSRLTGTLFVLDEPSVGLHPADVARLVPVVRRLTHGDNIAVVVEADERFIASADRVVELGPGAGENGGAIVFDGQLDALLAADTATGRFLRSAGTRGRERRRASRTLTLRGARGHNLQDVELQVPLGCLTCVTGVSGSGKSSLIVDTLVPAVLRALSRETPEPLPHAELRGASALSSAVVVDQAPLGRTSRGNPATYLGVWDALRARFAATPLARERGYKPGAFSFNVQGGRCEACKGEGAETVEMQFLADVRLTCPECGGKRFVGPVLDVLLEGKSIADALQMTAHEAHAHFARYPEIQRALDPLLRVGAGYLRLGQPLSTLSGGEAQRLKLAEALYDAKEGGLFVLDEPTAGLHGADVLPLLACLDALVDAGSTVILIEHDMRVAAHADHVIELGPGAGADGGRIVAEGPPERVAACAQAASAPFLARALAGERPDERSSTPSAPRAKDDSIRVRGAREHNLKHVDVDVPRERLVVVTGPSGSGKSTLAFDVIFAESQRRYLETLSPYVRQYLKQLPRPQVERVEGMPPGVSLEQKRASAARNSTVATVTEVAHYLRLLYARAGLLHCPECTVPIAPRPLEALWSDAGKRFGRAEAEVYASAIRGQKGSHRELLERARAAGVRRARIDGSLRELAPAPKLDRYKEHDIELLLGSARGGSLELRELLARALREGRGTARVLCGGEELLLSSERACANCGRGYPEPDPRFFSFNTRQGACPTCEGSGEVERTRRGESVFEVCPDCSGKRLSGLALHTTLDGTTLPELLALSVDAAIRRVAAIRLTGRDAELGRLPLAETLARLRFLERVGLSYLALDRAASSLSGGELQRVRLAAQLGSGLTGVLYVLDEPTIGLHPRDTGRLLDALRELVGQGCSVLVVEHDADTICAADHVIDVGPAGGHAGGAIVAQGPPAALLRDPHSVTGRALARPALAAGHKRRKGEAPQLELIGARQHNLKDVHLRVPLGRFVAVTGVSGSGKSTLVRDVLLHAVRRELDLVSDAPGAHERVLGASALKRAVEVDQSPIGRTPRSVPATYVGVWDEIRKLYAATPEARARGYDPARFSFNVKKGRCSECEGQGAQSVEMSFLPEALVTCESCNGLRYDPETLAVTLHGVSIGRLLELDIDEVAALLAPFPAVRGPLQLMSELGLGYLKLGQPSNTLSGGEAQRMKLVSELASGRGAGPTLYVMDEPTTGLHRDDVTRLLALLDRLVERGDTVLAIEHHPDLILHADWVIDLGPEGGEGGGRIIAEGTPEQIMRAKKSHTGKALRRALEAATPAPADLQLY